MTNEPTEAQRGQVIWGFLEIPPNQNAFLKLQAWLSLPALSHHPRVTPEDPSTAPQLMAPGRSTA